MGLLDDAIREHLELKRRRGADPTEIERLEQEALGPVRRGPEPGDALADTALADVGYEPRPDIGYEPAAGYDSPLDHDEWEEEVVEEPIAPRAGYTVHDDAELEEEWVSEPPEAESLAPDTPAPPASPPAPAMAPPAPEPEVGGETVEYDVEAEHMREDEADDRLADDDHRPGHDHRLEDDDPKREGDDVLEETPEFLQDTPDHDRLWFEQRPPKDFDFDG
jgi:hypothetical protein